MREIETAGGIPFTGIVHNSNLGDETTAQTLLSAVQRAEALAEKSGLPIVATAVKDLLRLLDYGLCP